MVGGWGSARRSSHPVWFSHGNSQLWASRKELEKGIGVDGTMNICQWEMLQVLFWISLLIRCPNLVEFYALHADWNAFKEVSPPYKRIQGSIGQPRIFNEASSDGTSIFPRKPFITGFRRRVKFFKLKYGGKNYQWRTTKMEGKFLHPNSKTFS